MKLELVKLENGSFEYREDEKAIARTEEAELRILLHFDLDDRMDLYLSDAYSTGIIPIQERLSAPNMYWCSNKNYGIKTLGSVKYKVSKATDVLKIYVELGVVKLKIPGYDEMELQEFRMLDFDMQGVAFLVKAAKNLSYIGRDGRIKLHEEECRELEREFDQYRHDWVGATIEQFIEWGLKFEVVEE